MTSELAMIRSVLLVGATSPGDVGGQSALSEFARRICPAESVAQALESLGAGGFDLIILRESLPPADALALVERASQLAPQVPVVVLAQTPNVDLAVQFVRAGAYDYCRGPLDRQALGRLVRGMEMEQARSRQSHSRFFCDQCPPGLPIVGQSPGMQRTLEMVRIVAESRCNPVLILGETGTGKELGAKAVHTWRCGSDDNFIAVNCAALTATLLESELFGHVKGAFTGADREKTGLFELAGTGSLFLDEISEMAPELQAKLLRALQEKTFRKVGGARDVACNATIIASSNCNLLEQVRRGRFRQDLYYRLAIFPITLPPLRDAMRQADIPLLAQYFLETSTIPKAADIRSISAEVIHRLCTHNWPGNVRELRNVIDRAIILEKGNELSILSVLIDGSADAMPASQAHCFTQSPRSGQTPAAPQAARHKQPDFSLETAEREFILRALKETGWQRTRAAALLGITRATLHAKLKRYDIRVPAAERTDSAASILRVKTQAASPALGTWEPATGSVPMAENQTPVG